MIPRIRRKSRKTRAEREWIESVREYVWGRDSGLCRDCNKPVPLAGDIFTRAHMAHTVRRWKLGPDYKQVWRPEVLLTKCFACHIGKEHNAGGKPVPRKVKP